MIPVYCPFCCLCEECEACVVRHFILFSMDYHMIITKNRIIIITASERGTAQKKSVAKPFEIEKGRLCYG